MSSSTRATVDRSRDPLLPARLATVFGLDVHTDGELSFLAGAGAPPAGRALELRLCTEPADCERGWPEQAKPISDQLEADGSVSFAIEQHPALGYRIRGARYGLHVLSPDGRRMRCAVGTARVEDFQRLLVAQALPFAAVLQGLEVFHAGAVALDGRAVALLGPSRAGKTSLARELCARGAGFLADDVLAIERRGSSLLGHPGSPVAGVSRDRDRDRDEGEDGSEATLGAELLGVDERERVVRMSTSSGPVPVEAMFFLDRRPDGPDVPRFEPVRDAQTLLAATFNFVIAEPTRLRELLEVCALASRRHVERAVFGPSTSVERLGAAVLQRLDPGS